MTLLQGFSTSAVLHLWLDNPLLWGALHIAECIQALLLTSNMYFLPGVSCSIFLGFRFFNLVITVAACLRQEGGHANEIGLKTTAMRILCKVKSVIQMQGVVLQPSVFPLHFQENGRERLTGSE